MKDYYFHATGEVRTPNDNDWVLDEDGDFIKGCYSIHRTYPIFTRHGVEVGGYKTSIQVYSKSCKRLGAMFILEIPISPPKKKVKKWIWECIGYTGVAWRTNKPYSEKEMEGTASHKIDETMREVEE